MASLSSDTMAEHPLRKALETLIEESSTVKDFFVTNPDYPQSTEDFTYANCQARLFKVAIPLLIDAYVERATVLMQSNGDMSKEDTLHFARSFYYFLASNLEDALHHRRRLKFEREYQQLVSYGKPETPPQ